MQKSEQQLPKSESTKDLDLFEFWKARHGTVEEKVRFW
jgi:hypothetical protein